MLSINNFFKKDPPQEKTGNEPSPSTESLLYGDSILYMPTDFPRYNPDDLIGRRGWTIYNRMMNDEQIKAAVKFRRNAVTGREWVFKFDEATTERLGQEEAQRRIDVLTHTIYRMPGSFKSKLNFIMKAIHQGFSVTEIVNDSFSYDGRLYWGIKSLKPKPFDTFYPIVDEYGDLVRLEQMIGGKRTEVRLPSVVWYVINPDIDEYYGQSELREAYRDWYSKDVLTKLENIYLERMAGGLVWAENTSDKPSMLSAGDKSSLQSVLSNIQTKTGIQMPANWKLNVNNPNSTTAFSDAIERHDRNMAKALLMPNLMGLTESGQTGSYSQSQTQLEGFLWMLDSDALDLAELLTEQLFKPLCEYNWGDGLCPEFCFNPLSKSQIYAVIDIWGSLVSSGAVTPSESDEEYLRSLMGFPERAETPGGDRQDGDDDSAQDDKQADDQDDDLGEDEDSQDMGYCDDHTFFPDKGMVEISYSKFARAQKRVDFSAIERGATVSEFQSAESISDTMGQLAAYLVDQVETNPDILIDPNEIAKIKIPAEVSRDIRRESKRALSDGWDLGIANSKRELEKAGKPRMSKADFAKFASVGDIATQYFNAKSFQMAGNLTDEGMAIFRNSILNGIKYSKTQQDVIEDIYTQFAQKGMISEDQAVAALGRQLDLDNPTYRIQTVVRTNYFEALNEGRYSFFTDQSAAGFVTGLMYSAILDSRTTEICSALDGRTWAADSTVWEKYRPPNHYNCRSLLIAVTTADEDVVIETGSPAVQPQEGFK